MKIASIIALIFILVPTTLSATEEKAAISLYGHGGTTSFSGDLSSEKSAPTTGFSMMIYSQERSGDYSTLKGIAGLFLVDFTNTGTKSKIDTKFPYTPDKKLFVSQTSFIPIFCAFASTPVQACAGVGWTMVRVSEPLNEQNYGSFRWDARIGHYLDQGIVGGLEFHYYDVRQKIQGVDSAFAAMSTQLALGYTL
jgi:hypothetical protein